MIKTTGNSFGKKQALPDRTEFPLFMKSQAASMSYFARVLAGCRITWGPIRTRSRKRSGLPKPRGTTPLRFQKAASKDHNESTSLCSDDFPGHRAGRALGDERQRR